MELEIRLKVATVLVKLSPVKSKLSESCIIMENRPSTYYFYVIYVVFCLETNFVN